MNQLLVLFSALLFLSPLSAGPCCSKNKKENKENSDVCKKLSRLNQKKKRKRQEVNYIQYAPQPMLTPNFTF